MKKKTKTRLSVGDNVIVVGSMHCHVTLQMEGVIEEVMPKGYAVQFEKTLHQKNFGGGKLFLPAIVYMREKDVKLLVNEIPK
jgi:translation initiation factor IF-1